MQIKSLFKSLLILSLLFSCQTFAATPSAATQQEIQYLFNHLKNSNCQFNRNGDWHNSSDAVAHLNKKYDYLLKKGLVNTSEDFINQAASKSSMSGKPYLVKCGNEPQIQSGEWFLAELGRYRKSEKR